MSMSSLFYLCSEDFRIENKTLVLDKKFKSQWLLVYFFMETCNYCKTFTPFFTSLPKNMDGFDSAIVNVNEVKMKRILYQTMDTPTPIKEVPFILLFFNGVPFERYFGPPEYSSLKTFVEECQKRIKSASSQRPTQNSSQIQQQQQPMQMTSAPPPQKQLYHPYRVCYMEFKDAYKVSH